MIEVECECGRVIKTKDENAGKKARCPDCGEVVQIPVPRKAGSKSPAASSKGVAASAVKSTKKRPPSEDEYDGEDEEFDGEEGEEEELPRSRSKRTAGKRPVKGKAEAEEPVVSKKKKKKKGEDADLNKNIIIGTCVVFGIAFLGLVGYGISKLGSIAAAPAVEVPKDFVEVSTPNGELRCQAPKGWPSKTGGGSGGVPPFLTFEQSGINIDFRSSPSGASIQMMTQAGNQNEGELPDELKPVSKVHEYQKEKIMQEDTSYQEKGAPEMIKGAQGEIRLSEFTASSFGRQVFGYRATMLGVNNQWNIICKCSASQWKDFQPVFRKIIESTSGS